MHTIHSAIKERNERIAHRKTRERTEKEREEKRKELYLKTLII